MTLVHPVSFESNTAANEVENTTENTTVENAAEAPSGPTFGQLGLPQQLVTALERRGIRHPFAIQTSALPDGTVRVRAHPCRSGVTADAERSPVRTPGIPASAHHHGTRPDLHRSPNPHDLVRLCRRPHHLL
jgi:hypothetical protein